jgi:hypothetical protein
MNNKSNLIDNEYSIFSDAEINIQIRFCSICNYLFVYFTRRTSKNRQKFSTSFEGSDYPKVK